MDENISHLNKVLLSTYWNYSDEDNNVPKFENQLSFLDENGETNNTKVNEDSR